MIHSPIVFLIALACTRARERPSDTQDQLPEIDLDMIPKEMRNTGLFGSVYKDGRSVPGHDDPVDEIPKTSDTETKLMHRLGLKKPGEEVMPSPNQKQDDNDYDENDNINPNETRKSEGRAKLWYDFPNIFEENQGIGGVNKGDMLTRWRTNVVVPTPEPSPKSPHFSQSHYGLQNSTDMIESKIYSKRVINWTDCGDFVHGAKFNPDDIVDHVWVPFFAWSLNEVSRAAVHKLSHPTLRMAETFQEKYGGLLGKTVDWERPKLKLEIDNRIVYLLVSIDNKGMFTAIPDIHLAESVKGSKNASFPTSQILLKIVHPYLVLVICNAEYAVAMAVEGQGPQSLFEKKIEAESTGFQGIGAPLIRNFEREEYNKQLARNPQRIPAHAKKILKPSMDHGIRDSEESAELAFQDDTR